MNHSLHLPYVELFEEDGSVDKEHAKTCTLCLKKKWRGSLYTDSYFFILMKPITTTSKFPQRSASQTNDEPQELRLSWQECSLQLPEV